MTHITFDYDQALSFLSEEEIKEQASRVKVIHEHLHDRTSDAHGYKGWVHLPRTYDQTEVAQITEAATRIQAHSDVLLVIGVGGSYLGARAAIEMLHHNFRNLLPHHDRQTPHVLFVGHNMSATYINDLKDVLRTKDFSINVISKSGTTTEPAIAFRIFKEMLLEKYGEQEANERIFITTDEKKGALRQLAEEEGNETFVIPGDIGGRYSVLTPVGLLPMAVSGIDITSMLDGARCAYEQLEDGTIDNIAYKYAAIRKGLYTKGKTVEILVNYEPNMQSFSKWWQQLFGESEGKNQQGIFPAYATFPTDLHSIGQYIQDGRRDLFETIIHVKNSEAALEIAYDEDNIDELNYLEGKTIDTINEKIVQGATLAHADGGVPSVSFEIPVIDAYTFGYLVYFFQKACAMSGYLHEVNPFDQPGVEAYKTNMFALLGKPGFEQQKEMLEKRLKRLVPEVALANNG